MARRNQDRYKIIDGVEHKLCSTCRNYIPMTKEYFNKRSASKDGLSYSCKKCERETAQKSYKRRQKKQKIKQYYEENREAYIERAKKRYKENKDMILSQQREWRNSDKGKKLMAEAGKRRRYRIKQQTPNGRDYTRQEIIERDSVFGQCICQICGEPIDLEAGELHIDHIIPIAAGGSDTKDNVRCVHKRCNITRPKDGSDLEA